MKFATNLRFSQPGCRVAVFHLAEGAADGGDVGDDVEPVQLAAIRPLVIQRQGELLGQEVVGHRQSVQPVVVAGLQLTKHYCHNGWKCYESYVFFWPDFNQLINKSLSRGTTQFPVEPILFPAHPLMFVLRLVLATVVVHLALHEETRVEVGDVDHAAAPLRVTAADLQVDLT